MEKQLLTPEEVSKQLSCSRRTIYNYISQGKLKAIRVNDKKLLISQEKLNNFLGVKNGNK